MSKTLAGGITTHVAGAVTSLAWAVKFTRTDAQVFRYTSAKHAATISAQVYEAAPGFDVSSITCSLGYDVDSLELTVLTNDDMTRADFLAGRWDQCRVEFSQFNFITPANGTIPWPVYRVANVEPIAGGFTLELRDLRDQLLQDHSRLTAKTCGYRLGDARCSKVLTSFTHSFTVTGVTSRSTFTCSGLAQAADYFSNGQVTFADGLHADLPLLVRSHPGAGVLTLAVPLLADVVIGQTGSIVAGCLKRLSDCIAFDNVLNFGGQPHAPGSAELIGQT